MITDITLSSGLSDGIEFLYSPALEHTPLTTGISNWWNELNTKIVDFPKRETKKEKIVKLVKKTNDWAHLNLEWQEKPLPTSQIIFTDK